MLAYHEAFHSLDSECKAFPIWWKWPSSIANAVFQSLLLCSARKVSGVLPFPEPASFPLSQASERESRCPRSSPLLWRTWCVLNPHVHTTSAAQLGSPSALTCLLLIGF